MLFPTVIPAFAAKTPEALLLILNEARSFDCVIARFALDHLLRMTIGEGLKRGDCEACAQAMNAYPSKGLIT
jgi:hypothetical protein